MFLLLLFAKFLEVCGCFTLKMDSNTHNSSAGYSSAHDSNVHDPSACDPNACDPQCLWL